jgi:hypothetical protein
MVLDAKCSQWPLLDTDASIVVGLLPARSATRRCSIGTAHRATGGRGRPWERSAALLGADGRLILETRQNLARR